MNSTWHLKNLSMLNLKWNLWQQETVWQRIETTLSGFRFSLKNIYSWNFSQKIDNFWKENFLRQMFCQDFLIEKLVIETDLKHEIFLSEKFAWMNKLYLKSKRKKLLKSSFMAYKTIELSEKRIALKLWTWNYFEFPRALFLYQKQVPSKMPIKQLYIAAFQI